MGLFAILGLSRFVFCCLVQSVCRICINVLWLRCYDWHLYWTGHPSQNIWTF